MTGVRCPTCAANGQEVWVFQEGPALIAEPIADANALYDTRTEEKSRANKDRQDFQSPN